jgi:hypothetical protein
MKVDSDEVIAAVVALTLLLVMAFLLIAAKTECAEYAAEIGRNYRMGFLGSCLIEIEPNHWARYIS